MSDVIRNRDHISDSSTSLMRKVGNLFSKFVACLQPTNVNVPSAYTFAGNGAVMAFVQNNLHKTTNASTSSASAQISHMTTATMQNNNLQAANDRLAFSARLAGAKVRTPSLGAYGAIADLAPTLAANNPAASEQALAASAKREQIRKATLNESEARLAFSARLAGVNTPVNTSAFGAYAAVVEMAKNYSNAATAMSIFERAEKQHAKAVKNMQARAAFSERLAGNSKAAFSTAALGEFGAVAEFSRKFANANNVQSILERAEKQHAKAVERMQARAAFSERLAGGDARINMAALGGYAAVAEMARNFANANTSLGLAVNYNDNVRESEARLAFADRLAGANAQFNVNALSSAEAVSKAPAEKSLAAKAQEQYPTALEMMQSRNMFAERLAGTPAKSLGMFGAVAELAQKYSNSSAAQAQAAAYIDAYGETETVAAAEAPVAKASLVETIKQAASNAAQLQAEGYIAAYGNSEAQAPAQKSLKAHNAAHEAATILPSKSTEQRVAERWQAIIAQLSAPELKHPVHLDAFNEQRHAA